MAKLCIGEGHCIGLLEKNYFPGVIDHIHISRITSINSPDRRRRPWYAASADSDWGSIDLSYHVSLDIIVGWTSWAMIRSRLRRRESMGFWGGPSCGRARTCRVWRGGWVLSGSRGIVDWGEFGNGGDNRLGIEIGKMLGLINRTEDVVI